MSAYTKNVRKGFCIYVDTFCQGPVPVERGDSGFPVVYTALSEAQREIAEYTIERLQQFLEGERDFDDAIEVEEYVVEVDVFPDGAIVDASGTYFGKAEN